MRRLLVIFVICLAAAGILYAQVSDRLGVQDMRYGSSWDRDLGTSTVSIYGLTPINVQGFPFLARGNDSSNDEDAIQAAIDSAYSWGGGTVYLPAGTYYVGGQGAVDSVDAWCLRMKSNVTIMGDGASTVIKMFPQKGRDVRPDGYPQAHMFYSGDRRWHYPTDESAAAAWDRVYDDLIDTTYATSNGEYYPSNIEIRDLCIDMDYPNQPSGSTHSYSVLSILSATNIRVINCRITGGVSETAYFYSNHPDSSTTNIVFSGNIIEQSGESGVAASGVHFNSVDGVTCNGNVFDTIGRRAIKLDGAWNTLVNGNVIRGAYDVGIQVVGSYYATISNNHLYDIGEYGIEVSEGTSYKSKMVVVSGNNILMKPTTGESGVFIENGQRVLVSANMVSFPHWADSDTTSYVGGVFAVQSDTTSSGGPELQDISIVGNTIYSIDEVYSTSGDTLKYAPAAIQLIDEIGTYDSRPQATVVNSNFASLTYDGLRIVNFDTVMCNGNYFNDVVRTGLDTSNVGYLFSVGLLESGAAAAGGRDSTGSKTGYEFTSPESE